VNSETTTYDVLILGSGLGGTTTASILAKMGWRVLVIDSSSHPRFAIGEATTPDISFQLKILARKYDIPELYNLTTFHRLRDNVSSACGIKKSFSFLYHREHEIQNPVESHQFPTLAPPLGPDAHLFRQDTDAYMMGVAVDYGADIRQLTRIQSIDFHEDGVRLTSDKEEEFHGRFLIDAAGFRSPVAEKLQLREKPSRLKTNSRTLFTHMMGVKHYDEVAQPMREYGHHYPFAEGTLHHVFEEGWMWVIPFNNHSASTNQLCSVGVLLNAEKCPKTDQSPSEEFAEIVGRFPKVAEQFTDAKPIREWVSTDRIQYSSSHIAGDRYCLLAHAAGFIDPLFSTGLSLTMTSIDDLIDPLNKSLEENSFQQSTFDNMNAEFQANLDFCDRVVSNSFHSFQDFDLWDAWFRVWVAGNFAATTLNTNLFLNYEQSVDKSWLDKNEEAPFSGVLASEFSPNRELFEAADQQMQKYIAGNQSATDAATAIRSLFESANYLPSYFKWHDKRVRSTPSFTIPDLTKLCLWYVLFAPKNIRDQLISFKLSGVFNYTWKSVREHRSRANSRKRVIWDTFFADN
jgi:FADH2 O2-dependent halogenase